MYHTAVYYASAATAGTSNYDFSAATDSVFTQRNNHYTFTVPLILLRQYGVGASLTQGRYQAPTWNAIGEFDIINVNDSATVPTNPQFDDYIDSPPQLPINEEFQVQYTNNLASSTEVESSTLHIGSGDWNRQVTPGQFSLLVQAKLTSFTPTAGAWSGPQAITLISNLRNGVYEVQGMALQGAHALAGRLVFPTQRPYMGRYFRPGCIAQAALGNQLPQQAKFLERGLGVRGRFHTFELPQIDIFGLAATSTTYYLFLWCAYLGTDLGLLTNWAAQGSMQSGI